MFSMCKMIVLFINIANIEISQSKIKIDKEIREKRLEDLKNKYLNKEEDKKDIIL